MASVHEISPAATRVLDCRVESKIIDASEFQEAADMIPVFFFDEPRLSRILDRCGALFRGDDGLSAKGKLLLNVLPHLSGSEIFMNYAATIADNDRNISASEDSGDKWSIRFGKGLEAAVHAVAQGFQMIPKKGDYFTEVELKNLTKPELIGILLTDTDWFGDSDYKEQILEYDHPAFRLISDILLSDEYKPERCYQGTIKGKKEVFDDLWAAINYTRAAREAGT